MARGEKRGNREAKKPKQDKPKIEPTVSLFAATTAKPTAGQRPAGGKK